MKKIIKDNVNQIFLKKIGITYDEYEKLDCDKQKKLLNNYHKKNSKLNKNKLVTVMIGGGDESIFIKVPKGKKVLTPYGYTIAGETLEENKRRFEKGNIEMAKNFEKLNKRFEKEYKKAIKLDFETWLYLYITKAIKVEHIPVMQVKDKKTIDINDCGEKEAYIFKNYDEYKKFYLMYLDDVDDDLIDLAIYTRGKKGQIVALKGLCERIIVKKKVKDFYNSITSEQIEEIHSKGKLTPLEVVQMWESYDLCIPGNQVSDAKKCCEFFNYKCHECLLEIASHKLEYDNIDFKVVNSSLSDVPQKKLRK